MTYKWICPRCGHEWKSDDDKEKSCPTCRYWSILVSYKDDNDTPNRPEYERIQRNVYHNIRYELECEDCHAQTELYFDRWVRCHCGGRLKLSKGSKEDSITREDLKAIRADLGYSQVLMAGRLGVSQGFYCQLELGSRPLSDLPILVKKLSVISGSIIVPAEIM